MIVLLPAATPVIVSVVATPALLFAFVIVIFPVGDTVALAVDPLVTFSVPLTLAFAAPDLTVAVNVFVFPVATVPDDSLRGMRWL